MTPFPQWCCEAVESNWWCLCRLLVQLRIALFLSRRVARFASLERHRACISLLLATPYRNRPAAGAATPPGEPPDASSWPTDPLGADHHGGRCDGKSAGEKTEVSAVLIAFQWISDFLPTGREVNLFVHLVEARPAIARYAPRCGAGRSSSKPKRGWRGSDRGWTAVSTPAGVILPGEASI